MTFLLIIILLLIPLIFQFIYGTKALNQWISLKFWQIVLTSFLGLIIMIIICFFLMLFELHRKGIKDGLPAFGVVILGLLVGIIILVVILIQLYSNKINNNDRF